MAKGSTGNLNGLGMPHLGDDHFYLDLGEHGSGVVAIENTVTKKGQPARVKFDQRQQYGFVPCGDDNLFFETVKTIIQESTILAPRLNQKANRVYNGGLWWGLLSYRPDGSEVFMPQMDTEEGKRFRAFLRRNNYQRTIWETIAALIYFQQTWIEFVLTNNLKEIDRIVHHQPRYCRHGWMNSNGVIDKTYIYGDWKKDPRGQGARAVFTVDPTYDVVGQMRASKKQNVILPLRMPDVLSDYYALAPWDSARQSKWLDIGKKIPKYKLALMDNQLSPSFRIRISMAHWIKRYPTWTSMKPEEQTAVWNAFKEEIKKSLSGADNAGKGIISLNDTHPGTNKEIEGVIIEPFQLGVKDGEYIEDSGEVSAQILSAIGEDPTLSGSIPSKSFKPGGGSDKKVAYDIAYALERNLQDIALEPYNIVRDFNGYESEWVMRIRNAMQAQLYSGAGLGTTVPNPTA